MKAAQPSSDEQWIPRAVADHEAALIRYAHSLVGNRELARDIVQDTFLRLVRQPRRKVERGVKTWLFTTCRRRALDVRKKESRMRPLPTTQAQARPDDADDAPAAAMREEAHQRLLQRVTDLPDKQREVIRLKFAQRMTYRQIAEVTGIKPGYVGYLLHHGLQTLRDQLTAADPRESH